MCNKRQPYYNLLFLIIPHYYISYTCFAHPRRVPVCLFPSRFVASSICCGAARRAAFKRVPLRAAVLVSSGPPWRNTPNLFLKDKEELHRCSFFL